MLTQLRIRNFKAWQDTGNIRLAPLTVFFGTNSSGKTSLLQFLLMLQQTVQSPNRRRVLNFADERGLVRLGVWPEMVFRREKSRILAFKLQWQALKSLLYSPDPDDTYQETDAEPLAFEAEVGELADETDSVGLKSFEYRLRPTTNGSFFIRAEYVGEGQYCYRSDSEPPEQEEGQCITVPAAPVNFHGQPVDKSGRFSRGFGRTEEFQALQYSLEHMLKSLAYLGPIRKGPDRMYAWAGDLPEGVGIDGENTVAALLSAKERQFTLNMRPGEIGLAELVASWLQQMGILESFQLKLVDSGRKEYEVVVRAAGMKDEVNVEIGVSKS